MSAPTPDVIITPFGVNAGGSYIQLPVPVPTQLPGNPGNASFNDGFPPDTMTPVGSGGIPPRGQDMNGILYMLSAYCQALTGGQFWPYNSTWEAANGGYAIGAMVAMANGAGFWLNTVNNNANNPDTTAAATSGWVPIAAYGKTSLATTGGTTTLTAVQAANPLIVVSGTLTSNAQLYLPAWFKTWQIVNNCTGNYAVSVSATGSVASIVIPQFANIPIEISADGAGNIGLGADIQTGVFIGTLTDGVNSGGVGLSYVISGGFACICNNGPYVTIPSANGVLKITGIPQGLLPPRNNFYPVTCLIDNSSNILYQLSGWVELVNNYMIFGLNKTNLVTNGVAAQISNFTASGVKGILGGFAVVYPIV